MNPALQHYLALTPDLYPHELEARFPRIIDSIVAAWPSPEQATAVFEDLLVDRRGSREGFPPSIAREIFQLSIGYEKLRAAAKEPGDVWSHEREQAQASLAELGMRVIPSDMLRAAERGDASRLELFLKAGMSVDARDSRDWTPLMVAAFHGNEAAARLLIESGANPAARDRAGYTPLHWAALKGYGDVVRLVVDRMDCNVQSASGLTPLLQAAAAGHTVVMELLLRAGADPDLASTEGWTPLHKAVANGHADAVTVLLNAGATVDVRHTDGTTPLALGVKIKRGDIVRLLKSEQSAPRHFSTI
jgi:hypothetical protein